MDMGEAIDMEYIDFRKLSKQAGAGSSHSANQDYGLRKLEKCILMAGCSEYQTDSEVKPEWWGRGGCVWGGGGAGCGVESKFCIDKSHL